MKHKRPKRVHAARTDEPRETTPAGPSPSRATSRGGSMRHGERSRGPFLVGVLVIVGAAGVIGGLTGRFDLGGTDPTAIVTDSPSPSAAASVAPSPTTSPTVEPTVEPSVEPSPSVSAEPSVSPEPSASPSTDPSATPSPSGPKGALVIQGAGDVSLDPAFLPILRSKGFAWAWSGLGSVFRGDDLSIVNLECPATTVIAPTTRTPAYRCSPDALASMRAAGVDVANQANEHVSDQGNEGLLDSLRRLRAAGIAPVGAGSNSASAIAPAVFERSGWKIAVIGIGQVTAQAATGSSPGTAGQDFTAALAGIRAAAQVADIVVVNIHWGSDGDTQPRSTQLEQAKQMVAAGADVIFGHHSHRLQPLKIIDGAPVFFSLGNLVWAAFSDGSTDTGIGRVTISATGKIDATIVPVKIASSAHPVLV